MTWLYASLMIIALWAMQTNQLTKLNTIFSHPLGEIVLRGLCIYLWITIPLLILTSSSGYSLNVDIPRGLFICFMISAMIQAFKKPNRQVKQATQKTYLCVVTELLQGDQNAAVRLFNYNEEKFGGKSDEWLWQKVIRDIERDRR